MIIYIAAIIPAIVSQSNFLVNYHWPTRQRLPG